MGVAEHRHQCEGSGVRKAPVFRRGGTFFAIAFVVVMSGALLVAGAMRAQNGNAGDTPRVTHGNVEGEFGHETPGVDPRLTERMELRRNDDRQKQLVADTDKLLLLAQELHEAVGKSNKDQLSLTVVRKSEAIEKLARSVKDRMRGY